MKKKSNDIIARILANQTGIPWTTEYKFHPVRKWRFDYANPDLKIAVEVEGGIWTNGRHTTGSGFAGDMVKYNEAVVLGWHLLRFTPDQMTKTDTYETIRRLITNLNTAK
jgi:very-short-patch-repair endonuclease